VSLARVAAAALTSAVLAAGACSSDEGGGAGGSGATGGAAAAGGDSGSSDAAGEGGAAGGALALAEACHAACDKIVAAGCTEEGTLAQCRSGCVNEYKPHEQTCVSETYELMQCLALTASYVCDAAGFAHASGCDPLLESFWACSTCVTAPGDEPCEVCSKANCCSERQAAYGAEGAAAALRCQALCADAACEAACSSAEPAAQAAFEALAACQSASCATTCTG
jgi:hypothetical protein